MTDSRLTHVDAEGRARMVDVGDKPVTSRRAIASGKLAMSASTLQLVLDGNLPKGNVVEVARIAGIQAAKRTADLIPLCHPLPLEHVDIEIEAAEDGLVVIATAATRSNTGVEMEALTAASVALLTLYDMCKAVDKTLCIVEVRLDEKDGGRSGTWRRSAR